ncbi:MAG: LacI family transcriptional regulator [Clostridiales bacterium]|nr:LacI family transcriptional regulator [Clostridiales bacterium]
MRISKGTNMAENQKRATLKDVAKLAGVSVMAVSNVMNNKGGISDSTAQRIREAAEKLNYIPNTVARSLRTSSSKIIGVITSSLFSYLHWEVLSGIDKVAAENDYSVIIHNTRNDTQKEHAAIELMKGRNIDGLIFIAPVDTSIEAITRLKNLPIPSVLILRSGEVDGEDYISSVYIDNIDGGYSSMKHLLSAGEKNVYMLINSKNKPSNQRVEGAKKALIEYRIDMPKDHIIDIAAFSSDTSARVVKKLIDDGVSDAAFWCVSDVIALGAINGILSKDKSIPDDFRVIGYDDINLIDYMKVPFTTMDQPKAAMGSDAAQLLIDQIGGKIKTPEHHIYKSVLKKRISTR